MCFNNQPKPPEIRPVQPPPQVKPLQIAQQSTLIPSREIKKQERKKVKFGARSSRDEANKSKTDAASLLIPMNSGENNSGGLNV